jgi:hypothetical protein
VGGLVTASSFSSIASCTREKAYIWKRVHSLLNNVAQDDRESIYMYEFLPCVQFHAEIFVL